MSGAGMTGPAGLLLLASAAASAVAGVPGDSECERGKGIERALGEHGYRVVVSGGFEEGRGRPVKLQVWENAQREWIITERFMIEKRTCVVRTGDGLHMMY